GAHPPNGFGPVPDRRRPGPLLHGRVEEGIGRGTEATIREGGGRRGRLCGAVDRERIDPVLLAHARAPAADRVLERAHVVERPRARIDLRILPRRAKVRVATSLRLAGYGVHRCAVRRATGDVEDALVRRARRVDPALDDLHPLEVDPGMIDRAGVL